MKLKMSDVGIAVLSTDRPVYLQKFLESIQKNTPVINTKVFVVDDSSEDQKESIKAVCRAFESFAVFVDTGNRIGVARNTNHAIKLLSKYPYKIIFNNDVECLRNSWWTIYPIAMIKTGFHCFSFRQLGLWGACKEGEDGKRPDRRWKVKDQIICTVDEKPHGCVIAYDKKMEDTVGFYDANLFKSYGMSHHFWCQMAGLSGIQPEGFHDVEYSNEFFKVHNIPSVTPTQERISAYERNKQIYDEVVSEVRKQIRPNYTPFC
jgi:hypothetical protein